MSWDVIASPERVFDASIPSHWYVVLSSSYALSVCCYSSAVIWRLTLLRLPVPIGSLRVPVVLDDYIAVMDATWRSHSTDVSTSHQPIPTNSITQNQNRNSRNEDFKRLASGWHVNGPSRWTLLYFLGLFIKFFLSPLFRLATIQSEREIGISDTEAWSHFGQLTQFLCEGNGQTFNKSNMYYQDQMIGMSCLSNSGVNRSSLAYSVNRYFQ